MAPKKSKSCKKSTQPKHERNDIKFNQLVKTVEEIQAVADKKLEEIANICLKRECK